MITKDKIIEFFYIIDEFCKHFDKENAHEVFLFNTGKPRRRRAA